MKEASKKVEEAAIRARVLSIISAIMGVAVSELNEQTTAKQITGWDSLKHMRLMMALENEFHVKFKPQQIIEMKNVGSIIDYIKTRGHYIIG